MSRIIRYALIVGLTACVPQQTVRPTPAAAEPVTAVARRAAATSPPPIFWIEAPIAGDPSPVWAQVPRTGVVVEDGRIRLLRPSVAETPRRVAIQAGHWRTDEAPAEFPRLRFSSGGEAAGIMEVDVTRDVAERVARFCKIRKHKFFIIVFWNNIGNKRINIRRLRASGVIRKRLRCNDISATR